MAGISLYNSNTPDTTQVKCSCGCSCCSANSATSATSANSATSAKGTTSTGSAQGSFDGLYIYEDGVFKDENGNPLDSGEVMNDINDYMKKNGIRDAGKTKVDNSVKAAQSEMNKVKNAWDACSARQNEYLRQANAARRSGDMDAYDRYMSAYNQCDNDITRYKQDYESATIMYEDAQQNQQDYYGTLYERYGGKL